MTPRHADALPPHVARELAQLRAEQDEVQTRVRAAVVAALAHGSVRAVAAAAGISPTTVQKWKNE